MGCFNISWAWLLHFLPLVISASHWSWTQGFLAEIDCEERWLEPRVYANALPGTYVMIVRAINTFGSTDVIYRLLTGNDKFYLDQKSGRLKTVHFIDRNIGDHYYLKINVASGGISKICNINVRVTIRNRHRPRFTKRVYLETINYNHQPGSEILTVETTDISTEPYNKETYYFLREEAKEDHGHMSKKVSSINKYVSGEWMYSELNSDGQDSQSLNEYLAIDRSTGVVYLKRQLDDNVGRITAVVLVVDGGSPPLRSTAAVEITVKTIGRPSNVRVENITATGATACWLPSPIGQAKGFKIQLQDLTDGDKNQSLEVLSSPVQPSCANLSGLQLATSYELWVFGYDDQMAGLNSTKVLFTTQIEVELCSQLYEIVCGERLHEARIFLNAPVGTYVMRVRAYDELRSTDIIYRLQSGNTTFNLDEKTGLLTTATAIHTYVGYLYNLSVKVMSGTIAKHCNIMVRVTDINRHRPYFRPPIYGTRIPYDHTPGSTILTVKAWDKSPESYNKEIYYFLREQNIENHGHLTTTFPNISPAYVVDEWMYDELDNVTECDRCGRCDQRVNRYLAINRSSGEIGLKQQLDVNVGRITAVVLAVDGGSPPLRSTAEVEITVKTIGPPLNVSVDNITDTGATACWLPPAIGIAKDFTVQFRTVMDQIIRNQSLFAVGSSVGPSCVYLDELEPQTTYELNVFGFDEQITGLSSDNVQFTTLKPRCPADFNCGNGTCHSVISLLSKSVSHIFLCECQDGFYGEHCQYFNPCALEPCLSSSNCEHRVTHECHCRPGYYGQQCERVDPCVVDNRCVNGGICRNISDNQTVCYCPLGFTGMYCEHSLNVSSRCVN